jgi:glucose-induced degradation protein 8
MEFINYASFPDESRTGPNAVFLGNRRDINALIMDYLINAGYPSAARRFAKEAGIEITPEIVSIEDRVEIRNAIHSGDIQVAIEKINELDPQV